MKNLQRTPITLLRLCTTELSNNSFPKGSSSLISHASSYFDLLGYAFLAPGITKDPSLGNLFEKVESQEGNRFDLELGVALPDLFPNLNGQADFTLSVANGVSVQELCFSNTMARLRYTSNGELRHALICRQGLPMVASGEIDFIPKDASIEYLRTFATTRFEIIGSTAEEAFETYCESCIHDLIDRLNRCLKALPFVDSSPGRVHSTAYSTASLPSFYFMIEGKAGGETGHGWISPHFGRSMMKPPDLTAEQSQLLSDYVSGVKAVDDIDALLHSAQTFLDGGVLDYVLLLSVIAAESATQRCVQGLLSANGVSTAKIEESKKDLTYSMMLNLLLVSLVTVENKPDKDLLGKMNRARSLRNAYMHNGQLPKDKNEIVELFEHTKLYVNYLRTIPQSTKATEE